MKNLLLVQHCTAFSNCMLLCFLVAVPKYLDSSGVSGV